MRYCARIVHRSFRRVEHAADWLTGRAGPVFVLLCTALVSIGAWSFFTTMFCTLATLPPTYARLTSRGSKSKFLQSLPPAMLESFARDPLVTSVFHLNLAACCYIVYSIFFHYYMAATEPPGSVTEGLSSVLREKRSGEGSSAWWASVRTRAARASTATVKRRALVVEPAIPMSVLKSNEEHIDNIMKKTKSTSDARAKWQASDAIQETNLPLHAPTAASSHQAGASPASSSSHELHRLNDSFGQSQMQSRHSHRSSSSTSSVASSRATGVTGHNLLAPQPRPGAIRNLSSAAVTRASPSPPPRKSWESLEAHERIADHLDEDSDDLFPLSKMCTKCTPVPLSRALISLPPELRLVERALRGKRKRGPSEAQDDVLADDEGSFRMDKLGPPGYDEDEAGVADWLGEPDASKLVPPPKPERTHHCSICKACVLKYDHHCPWLNQCVGLGNERYFVLFVVWLGLACVIITGSGWQVAYLAVQINEPWPHAYTPRVFVLLTWLLATIMAVGLGVMSIWQLVLVAHGETSVESHDNAHYDALAKRRGQKFINVYDLGPRRNLELFFNVGEDSKYSYFSILLPIRVPPYSDGWHWAKRRGLGGRHAGIEAVEELTDDEGPD
ncbi:hypothetical protein K437DRAFT_219769 [Tilletiaria anomala UBC 951]|uniref:Palmitoyltransferase n=1 Tax=Tilletiaria anomala (strain ATCC 24038 / CBS 436.72 / UBC 951) TaxID=1037660 RepID=A0A066WPK7_TILAU|nr:uncharacterized protein K437DRAFT_219769 [Tilletiaria anomala UBC 951]KDN52919.1 hypothetical protein K437DRAFT_219769 [Tilletiaria anomala UBC 951]